MNFAIRRAAGAPSGLVTTILKSALLSFVALVIVMNGLASLTPNSRLISVVSEANRRGELNQWSNTDNDMFTECAMYYMSMLRGQMVIEQLFTSRFDMPASHPCDGVRFLLDGHLDHQPEDSPISRHFYGSRRLFNIVATFLGIAQIRSAYAALSVLAPILLWFALGVRSPVAFLTLSPLILSLLVGFGLSNMGANIAHAPGFFVPILCLCVVAWKRDRLLDPRRRVRAYVVIASVTTYLDILHGPLPCLLFLTIVANHLLFHATGQPSTERRRRPWRSWRRVGPWLLNKGQWLLEAVGLVLLFAVVFAVFKFVNLLAAALVVNDSAFTTFFNALSYRLSSTTDGTDHVTRTQVWERLWSVRGIYFSSSTLSATAYYVMAGVAWIIVVIVTFRDWLLRLEAAYGREVVVLGLASSGVVLWYVLFVNHTYVHYQFMGRIAVLPASAGVMALLYMCRTVQGQHLRRAGILASATVLPLTAALSFAFPAMRLDEISLYRAQRVDVLSCSNDVRLAADGIPDVVLRARISNVPAILNVIVDGARLERTNPGGVWSTTSGTFPLALLGDELRALNSPDRSVRASIGPAQEIYVAFCSDGTDRTTTKYRLDLNTNIETLSAPSLSLGLAR